MTASCAAVALIVGCSVQESTRSGGLIAPVNTPAPTEATVPPPTLVTVVATADQGTAADDLESHLEGGGHDALSADTTGSSADLGSGREDDGAEVASTAGDTAATSASSRSEPTTPHSALPWSAAHEVLATAEPPDGFGEGVLTVQGTAGTQEWPVVVADTAQTRHQGLMGVADFAGLGGYAAMVFVFEADTSGAFWMRDTPLPLRITFVTAEGAVVSGADMTPCLAPTPSEDCERYFPDGPYRIAIEHPLDPAFDIGLAAAERIELVPH